MGSVLIQANYWGIAISRLAFCVELLGYDSLQCFMLHQAIGDVYLSGSCSAASYWGIVIRKVVLSSKLLRDCNSEVLVLCRAIGEYHFARVLLALIICIQEQHYFLMLWTDFV